MVHTRDDYCHGYEYVARLIGIARSLDNRHVYFAEYLVNDPSACNASNL